MYLLFAVYLQHSTTPPNIAVIFVLPNALFAICKFVIQTRRRIWQAVSYHRKKIKLPSQKNKISEKNKLKYEGEERKINLEGRNKTILTRIVGSNALRFVFLRPFQKMTSVFF